jgi:murein L,D-transpeptidase YcbB/YkuD
MTLRDREIERLRRALERANDPTWPIEQPRRKAMAFGIGDVVGIVFKLLANQGAILQVVNRIVAIWPEIRKLIDAIAPGMIGTPSGSSPAAAGGGSADGFSIEWLQESLNKLEAAGLEVDGEYGPATMEAVRKFQAKHGLTADGWAGVQTSAAIYQLLAR